MLLTPGRAGRSARLRSDHLPGLAQFRAFPVSRALSSRLWDRHMRWASASTKARRPTSRWCLKPQRRCTEAGEGPSAR